MIDGWGGERGGGGPIGRRSLLRGAVPSYPVPEIARFEPEMPLLDRSSEAHKAPAQLLKPHPERIGTVFVAGVLDREVYGTREAAAAAREAENRLRARP